MNDELDRILANEVEITPSADFLPSVMKAVDGESIARPPIEFPWTRALPGFLAALVALVGAVWNGIAELNNPVTRAFFEEQISELTVMATGLGLQRAELEWMVLAVVITIVSATLPLGLVNFRRGALT